MATNAQHSNKTAEWYTPSKWVELARQVMGGIDLDPASCCTANATILACRYYTQADDGLSLPWYAKSVWLNPPSGRGVPQAFARKLYASWLSGTVKQAVYLGYSLEQLAWFQRNISDMPVHSVDIAIPRQRIKFVGAGNSPTHGNFFAHLPESRESSVLFRHLFHRAGCTILSY